MYVNVWVIGELPDSGKADEEAQKIFKSFTCQMRKQQPADGKPNQNRWVKLRRQLFVKSPFVLTFLHSLAQVWTAPERVNRRDARKRLRRRRTSPTPPRGREELLSVWPRGLHDGLSNEGMKRTWGRRWYPRPSRCNPWREQPKFKCQSKRRIKRYLRDSITFKLPDIFTIFYH